MSLTTFSAMLSQGEPFSLPGKIRYPPCDSVGAQRVEHRIYVYDTFQFIMLPVYPSYQLIADILPLQLVAVDACHYRYAFFSFRSFLGT